MNFVLKMTGFAFKTMDFAQFSDDAHDRWLWRQDTAHKPGIFIKRDSFVLIVDRKRLIF